MMAQAAGWDDKSTLFAVIPAKQVARTCCLGPRPFCSLARTSRRPEKTRVCATRCPAAFDGNLSIDPSTFSFLPTQTMACICSAEYMEGSNGSTYDDATLSAGWSSSDTSVSGMDANNVGQVDAFASGTSNISANSSDCGQYNKTSCSCNYTTSGSAYSPATVQVPTSVSIVSGSSSTANEAQCTTTVNGQQQTGCGVTRTFTYQVDDQYGSAIQQAMEVWDSISVDQQNNGLNMSQPNTTYTGKPAGTNNGPCGVTTNSLGQFGEALSVCSTYCWSAQSSACVSPNLSTAATQTPHADSYTLQTISLSYQCGQVLVNGK